MNQLRQLRATLSEDPERLRILRLIRSLDLPDCWAAAGFVRSAIWDKQHNRTHSPLPPDIDVIWFDETRADSAVDTEIETNLLRLDSSLNWSVKNQARMHSRNNDRPYESATDAMMSWPETATAVAVRLGMDDVLEVAAPFGLDDLFNLVVRPTARFRLMSIFLAKHSRSPTTAFRQNRSSHGPLQSPDIQAMSIPERVKATNQHNVAFVQASICKQLST